MKLLCQGHGMRDQLQSFVQGAVMFDVHSLVFGIGNAKQGFCVLIVFSRIIDLQFYTK